MWFDSTSPPGGYCPGCGDLIDAAVSFFGELIQDLVDWFNTYFGGSVPDNLINKE
jgi:hypothetical protein